MGKIDIKANAELGTRLVKDDFFIDLCENIHLHYRDLRIEFSKDEWKEFVKGVEQFDNFLDNNPEYSETDFRNDRIKIPVHSSFFPTRLQFEKQLNGTYHLHWGNTRLEMTENDMWKLRDIMDRIIPLTNVKVSVIDKLGTWNIVSLYDSPHYKALLTNNKKLEEDYRALILKFDLAAKEMTTEEFFKLYEQKYSKDRYFQFKDNNILVDGHHRCAILLAIYGGNYAIGKIKTAEELIF